MASEGRFIDTVQSPAKTDNVQVLVVGLSRTGTMSMFYALKKLGYRSYHMLEACARTRDGHLAMWMEAVQAKYPDGSTVMPSMTVAPYTSSDFHKLLQDYDALADIPSIHFVPELLAAYPNAKLILTTHPRGVDAWLRSVDNCSYRINSWSIWDWPLMVYDKRFTFPYITLLRRSMEIWTSQSWPTAGDFTAAKPRLHAFYTKHNEKIRQLAREQGRPLLEFDPREGWAPLCEFLGKEIPSGPYPHANEGNYVVNLNKYVVLHRLSGTFGTKIAMTAGALAMLGFAWWWAARTSLHA